MTSTGNREQKSYIQGESWTGTGVASRRKVTAEEVLVGVGGSSFARQARWGIFSWVDGHAGGSKDKKKNAASLPPGFKGASGQMSKKRRELVFLEEDGKKRLQGESLEAGKELVHGYEKLIGCQKNVFLHEK